jgi:AcrR family transcriptional regulator
MSSRTPSKARPAGRSGRRPSPLREQARGVYRDAILEAAAEVLAEHGYVGTRMQEVASRAGLAIGTLYNYFTNKDELTLSLMDLRGRQFVDRIAAMLGELPADASVVVGIVDIAFSHIEQHRALFAMSEEGQLCSNQAGFARCGEMRHLYQSAVRGALTVAQQRGELRTDVPLGDLETVIGGMIRGVAHQWIAGGCQGSLRDRAPLLVDVFLHGVGRR